jgi:hypothetical protein
MVVIAARGMKVLPANGTILQRGTLLPVWRGPASLQFSFAHGVSPCPISSYFPRQIRSCRCEPRKEPALVASLVEDGAHFIMTVAIALEPPMLELHAHPRAASAMKCTSISVCRAGPYCQSAAISQEGASREYGSDASMRPPSDVLSSSPRSYQRPPYLRPRHWPYRSCIWSMATRFPFVR